MFVRPGTRPTVEYHYQTARNVIFYVLSTTVKYIFFFFFFQAEDGIRDYKVTGVQTCALPISKEPTYSDAQIEAKLKDFPGWWYEDGWIRRNYKTDGWPTTLMLVNAIGYVEIGRASCRERV